MNFFRKLFERVPVDQQIRKFSCGTIYSDKPVNLDTIDMFIGEYELWNGKILEEKRIEVKLADRVWFLENQLKKRENAIENHNSLKLFHEKESKELYAILRDKKKKIDILQAENDKLKKELQRIAATKTQFLTFGTSYAEN